jgi:hypothetical protein
MRFSYNEITLGDLDIELNYRNFGIVCDGDNHIITINTIENELED